MYATLWVFMDEGGNIMEYGLIGEKLGHSYSKLIQEKLLDDYTYEICPIAKDDLDAFMQSKQFTAINVTIPYKQSVIPYLSEMSDAAKSIGAVNTVVNKQGKLIGYNTDYLGFAYTLDFNKINVQDKKVLVLGNGGASKAIQAVVQDKGAKQIVVTDLVSSEDIYTMQDIIDSHLDVEIIINTTPCGMYPHIHSSAIDLSLFKQCRACVDVIYNPLRTQFLLDAKQLGMQSVGGLEMLVAQAKYALEFFKDIVIDDSHINRIYEEIILNTSNIIVEENEVLAHTLAKHTNKQYIDIEEVTETIALHGEHVIHTAKPISKEMKPLLQRNSLWVQTNDLAIDTLINALVKTGK